MKQELVFKSQAKIIRSLGDELISGEVAAIIELVKNAYDADAGNCYIEINPNEDFISIRDDGHGMSLSDVQTKWVELGTDNKLRNKKTISGRRVLGNKGIGRLAAAKLGRYLKIVSTTQIEDNLTTVTVEGIDWDAFLEKENRYIDDVKFYAEEFSHGDAIGTTIIISKLNQVWEKNKLEALVQELRKLISPIAVNEDGFNLFLNLDAFTEELHKVDGRKLVNGRETQFSLSEEIINKIEPFPILDACDYTFEAEYSANKLTGILKINDAKIKHKIDISIDAEISLGDGLIQLNIFDRDIDSIKNTFVKAGVISREDKKLLNLRDARRHLDELSGIAIYRNNFRIRPYGDKDSDWLNLAQRRVQNPSKCLEQKQISGLILVDTAENSGLVERSSREGFDHNDNFIAFKDLLLKAIHEIEVLRKAHNAYTGKNRAKQKNVVRPTFLNLRKQANLKKIERFSSKIPKEKRIEFKNAVSEYKTSLDKLIDIIQERQSILEARSTLGFILAEVVHEAKHPTSAVGSDLISLSKRVNNKWQYDISEEVSKTLLERFSLNLKHIVSLDSLFKRLDPLINVRRRKSYEFSVHEAVKKSLLLHQKRAERAGVKITHEDLVTDIKIIGLDVDISTAIINLIDNALYWHEQRKTPDPYISINYKDSSNVLNILISDNAGGISEKYTDAIFDVGFTTKEEGSGLGLSIAREALGRAGAYISHENKEDESGSIFTIEIRKDI